MWGTTLCPDPYGRIPRPPGASVPRETAVLTVLMAIIEPFLLIALGFLLKRTRRFSSKELWNGVEKLVFWVLFPPLLFNSVASAQLSGLNTAAFLAAGCFAMTGGIFMAKGVSVLAPADPMTDASVRQTGYRYNAYICFAMALNLYGKDVMALAALLAGVWVPISNAIAVTDLSCAANKGRGTDVRSIVQNVVTNPLIVATLAGLAANILRHTTGLTVPVFVTKILSTLGNASTATALLAIGAGLAVEEFSRYRWLITLSTIQRLVVLPAFALAMGLAAGLEPRFMAALMCYAMVPTANSCYIMASRMGGNGAVVSDLTSVEVLASLVTIPLWCVLLERLVF